MKAKEGGRSDGDLQRLKAKIEDLRSIDTCDLSFAGVAELAESCEAAVADAARQFGQEALRAEAPPFYCKEVKLAGDVKWEAIM